MQARYRVPWITYSNKMRSQAKRKLIHILKSAYPEFYSNKISCMWSVPVIYPIEMMIFFSFKSIYCFQIMNLFEKRWKKGGRREKENDGDHFGIKRTASAKDEYSSPASEISWRVLNDRSMPLRDRVCITFKFSYLIPSLVFWVAV